MYGKKSKLIFSFMLYDCKWFRLKKEPYFYCIFISPCPKMYFSSLILCHNTIFKHKMLVIRSQDFWSSSSHDNPHSWGCSKRSVAVWLEVNCMWLDEMLPCMVKLLTISLRTIFSRSFNKLATSCNSGN